MATLTKDDIISAVEQMTVLELATLVKELETRFGVSAPAPMLAPTNQQMIDAATPAQTEFTVTLTTVGEKKIEVIKEVRAITGLGLKEAKDLVEAAPKAVKAGISKADAEKIKTTLEAAGATVEIK